MYQFFDIHTHTYPEALAEKAVRNLAAFYEFTVDGKGTYSDLEETSVPFGAVGFLLFSVATNPHQVPKVNDGIAALVKKSRGDGFITRGFAGMHQDYPDFEGELDRIEKAGLQGVKIHPDIQGVDIDDPRLMKLYEIMEGRLPLYLHMGDSRPQYRFSEAEKLIRVKKAFPKLEVVAAHLGGYQAWDEAEKLAGIDGIWFDTSSALWAMTPERAGELISLFGADRVMFGTDYPVKRAGDELARFMKINLSDRDRRLILLDNAKRFLKIE